MNPQGGGAGLGNYGAAAGIGHGMLNMSMLQSLEQMMGGQSEGGLSMMMGGVHEQVSTGAGMTVAGAVSSIPGDIGRPDSNSMIRAVGAGSNGDTGSSGGLRVQQAAGGAGAGGGTPSRYESQKRRDWNTFGQYLKNHRPPLALARCSGAHVLEFLRYLDQFGKTKVHAVGCPFFGHPQPPAPCACPLRQAWGSLDALIGRLRAAYEEHGGKPESNPFGARAVRLYLREVRETQAKARGIAYEKKKRKRPPPPPPPPGSSSSLAIPGAGPCPPTTHDHSKFQPPHPAPPPGAPPAAAPSSSTEHQSLLSGSSSLLIPSFN